jgi:glycosyltransferase involved in cell wall biosynthesis
VAKRLGVHRYLEFSGVLCELELVNWYRGALLVAFVSLYEGFGLPIIEAMAVGVPVLTSNVSAMPETAGGAAFIVDPVSVDEISHGLRELAYDKVLRAELITRGKHRAKAFSWETSACEVWRIVRGAHNHH